MTRESDSDQEFSSVIFFDAVQPGLRRGLETTAAYESFHGRGAFRQRCRRISVGPVRKQRLTVHALTLNEIDFQYIAQSP